jgi:hypothetical protein
LGWRWEKYVLTPAQRSTRARIAANTRWSGENGKANAERAQAGLKAKFVRETRERFPELSEPEIQRRAESAYRAHMQRLALKSSKARQISPIPTAKPKISPIPTVKAG